MTEWYGWAGTMLRVDLTDEKIIKQPLPEEWVHNFLGGRNLNSKILFDEVPAGADPLGSENKLIIGTGPLTGTLGPGTGRFTVSAKSPLTGIHGDANSGGDFGPEMKYAGYDHIVISGKAKRPVYLWIDDDHVELRDASHLWGKTVFEADKIIRMKDIGDREIKTLIIGPAGENLVRYAIPVSNLFRAPGRCGMGAVMGSKNLKAVVVRGSKSIRIANPKEYIEYLKQMFEGIFNNSTYRLWSTLGTPLMAELRQEMGQIPVRNCQDHYWDGEKAKQIHGENFLRKFAVKSKACFGCPVHCSHGYVVREGPYAGTHAEGLEWGTIGPNGPNCDNPRLDSICKVHLLASEYGLDTISTGNTISFAMELFEKGVIDEADTGGIALKWGDHELLVDLYKKIAYREGFGDLLAEGKRGMVERLGPDAEEAAWHIKWLDDVVDTRGDIGRSLNYAVSTRGADHLRGLPVQPQFSHFKQDKHWHQKHGSAEAADLHSYHPIKADIVMYNETICSAADALEVCKFNTEWIGYEGVNLGALAKLASLVTGLNISAVKLKEICDRGWMVERAFSIREGITSAHDIPSARFFEPVPSGPLRGSKLDEKQFKELLKAYYEKKGFDVNTGIPTRETLERLGLKKVADELEQILPPKRGGSL